MLDVLTARLPRAVFIQLEDGPIRPTVQAKSAFTLGTARVEIDTGDVAAVRLLGPDEPIQRIVLRWELPRWPDHTLFLGDAWERSYGELQWQHLRPERILPWYMLTHDCNTEVTSAVGVRVQPLALCFWTSDPRGVSLWLDVRNGGSAARLAGRMLNLVQIVGTRSAPGESAFAVAQRFCRQMCPTPRLAPVPIVGNNNWYYSYGVNTTADHIRRDAEFLAELANGHPVKPFAVIDGGWSAGGVCPGGPYTHGRPDAFPDMRQLADDLIEIGVRPGIWIRPAALSFVDNPALLRPGPQPGLLHGERALDLTLPETLQYLFDEVVLMRDWGYELIKHDFSTYDLFSRWGFAMGAELTDPGWHFADRTLTNAEIILRMYRIFRDAAEDALLLGCNTIGHLAAGLFEIQRIGDDTSGKVWERTRRMGVNTLAFRLCQHQTFFAADADCVAHTPRTPWALDRQWLDLGRPPGNAPVYFDRPQFDHGRTPRCVWRRRPHRTRWRHHRRTTRLVDHHHTRTLAAGQRPGQLRLDRAVRHLTHSGIDLSLNFIAATHLPDAIGPRSGWACNITPCVRPLRRAERGFSELAVRQ